MFLPKIDPFEGLFGVFADSLPDGWGRLLVDRLMRRNGFAPGVIGSLERLAIVGTSGMGALTSDDHSKNFTYIYKEEEQRWVLSPAYDLTYSNSIGGEHATTINGNGKNPGMADILAVAKKIGLNGAKVGKIANEIKECIFERLSEYI